MTDRILSGLYERTDTGNTIDREVLRLDVDGPYPLMAASGTLFSGDKALIHWVAGQTRETETPQTETPPPSPPPWSWPIVYQAGHTEMFPYANVRISLTKENRVQVDFEGEGRSDSKEYTPKFSEAQDRISQPPTFHEVTLEFDAVEGVNPVLSIAPPTRLNPKLSNEPLTIEKVFNRSGFKVTRSNGDSIVPLKGAGGDEEWSDNELHDAMQSKLNGEVQPDKFGFSQFKDAPQWALWVFFAGKYKDGAFDGMMFDQIGPFQRQGAAIFTGPLSEGFSGADLADMTFFTAVHEMGHAFNLDHSGTTPSWLPWITSPKGQFSFMDEPKKLGDDDPIQNALNFLNGFKCRFHHKELIFLRHTPDHFVQPGNAAFRQISKFPNEPIPIFSPLRLEIVANRPAPPVYQYLEPVVLELRLNNPSPPSRLVPKDILSSPERMKIIVQKQGESPRRFRPFFRCCRQSELVLLDAGKKPMRDSLFISAGLDGWMIQGPGVYDIQISLRHEGKEVVSNRLSITVKPPAEPSKGADFANEFFKEDVARVLTFDGSRFLNRANTVLDELTQLFPTHPAAVHALIALAMAQIKPYKLLRNGRIEVLTPTLDPISLFTQALGLENVVRMFLNPLGASMEPARFAAQTLGLIDYQYYTKVLCALLRDLNQDAVIGQIRIFLTRFLTQLFPGYLMFLDDIFGILNKRT